MIGIKVYPLMSPRIIEVADPEKDLSLPVDISVQEIVNLIRDWEDDDTHMCYDPLIDAAGKEQLGGGVLVGITATLQNAQIRFTPRVDELSIGTVTTGDSGGKILHDINAKFETDGVYPGCVVVNNTTTAMETITSVESEIELKHFNLSGGTRNDWQIGDSYSIYPNVQCVISGGNLVAVDEDGNNISPILQSPNVQIISSSSSSATLQELEAIQFASYQNTVWIDVVNGEEGTAYPVGTRERPSNNIEDALIIAERVGLKSLYMLESVTLGSGINLTNFHIRGESQVRTVITIESDLICPGVIISNCKVTGTLDGGVHIECCMVGDLNYINGCINSSGLYGNIALDGGLKAVFNNCITVDQDNPPIIDMGTTGQSLAMPNYSGIVTIKELNDPSAEIGIGLMGGVVTLDPTIVDAREVIISGVGILYDNSTLSTPPNTDGLVSKQTISTAVWDEPLNSSTHNIDGTAGRMLRTLGSQVIRNRIAQSGTDNTITLDAGASPVDDAYDPAMISIIGGTGSGQSRLIYQYDGSSKIAVVDRNWETNPDDTSEFVILGNVGREHVNEGLARGATVNTVTLNANASTFDDAYIGQSVFIKSGTGRDQIRVIEAYDGTTQVATLAYDWEVIPDSTSAYVMMPALAAKISAIAGRVWNETRSKHEDTGTFGAVTEWSGVGGSLDPDQVAQAVWDANKDDYNDPDTMGELQNTGGSGSGLDADAVAAAVWNAISTTYGTPGTMGWLQNLIDEGIISVPKLIPGE